MQIQFPTQAYAPSRALTCAMAWVAVLLCAGSGAEQTPADCFAEESSSARFGKDEGSALVACEDASDGYVLEHGMSGEGSGRGLRGRTRTSTSAQLTSLTSC